MDPFLIFFTVINETIKLLAENMDEFVHNLDEGKHPNYKEH